MWLSASDILSARAKREWLRVQRAMLLLSVLAFYAGMLRAAQLYPGGTWVQRGARGYSLFGNYLCDVLLRTSLNGEPNPVGAQWGKAAFIALIPGIFLHFWRLGEHRRTWAAYAIQSLGAATTLAFAGVFLFPSDRAQTLHRVAVLSAAGSGLVATLLALGSQLRSRDVPRAETALGTFVLALAATDVALYVRTIHLGAEASIWVPGLQKLAALLLGAWMLAVASRRVEVHRMKF
jgi:hypothetical protein